MSKKAKIVGISGILVLVGVIAILATFWFISQQPLYRSGMVRTGENLGTPLAPPEQSGDPDFWRVEDGVDLYHFARGSGRNVLVIHGGPGFPFLEPLAGLEPLTGSYRFHYYDQRGCGQSTRPVDTFTSRNYFANVTSLDQKLGLGAQVADIERLRQILGEEKLILIGHSFGGFLASLYAAEFPEHVAGMVLIAPGDVLVMPHERDDLFTLIGHRLPADERAEYEAFMADYLDFAGIFSRSEADLAAMNRQLAGYFKTFTNTGLPAQGEAGGWMVHGMYLSMGLRHDYRGALSVVTAPVLVLHGENDWQSEAVSRMYAESLANSRLEVIPKAGHFMFVDRPQEFAELLGDFLNGLPPS